MAKLRCSRAGCQQMLQAGATYCSPGCRSASERSPRRTLVAGSMIVAHHDAACCSADAPAMIESTEPTRSHRAPRRPD